MHALKIRGAHSSICQIKRIFNPANDLIATELLKYGFLRLAKQCSIKYTDIEFLCEGLHTYKIKCQFKLCSGFANLL